MRPLDDGWVGVWTGLLNEDVYEPDPAGGWKPPLGVTAVLEHRDPDVGGEERFLLTIADGTTYRFERPTGWSRPDRLPLLSVTDRFGNGQRLAYDVEGRVARVTDDLGRFLDFRYGDCGLLEALADSAGRVVRYEHDDSREHLRTVVQPATAEAPDGARTHYEYDDGESHGRLRHNSVRVIGADGCAKIENHYGKDPGSDDFARLVTQIAGEQHRADFRVTRLLTPARHPDAVNVPAVRVESVLDGDYRVTTFNFRGNVLEERYRLARDGSWRLVVEAYRYDERGNLSLRRRPNGQTTTLRYDTGSTDPRAWANLLETWIEAPPAKPAMGRRIMRAQYEPAFQLLRRVEDERRAETRFHYGHELTPGGVPALVRVELPEVTLPDGTTQVRVQQYAYDARGRLVRETSPEGRVVERHYGTTGAANGYLVEQVRDPGGIGATDRFSYDAYGNVSGVEDGEGAQSTLEFDARNRLVRVAKPVVGTRPSEIHLRYHRDGPLAELRRPSGAAVGLPGPDAEITTRYEYDTLDRLISQLDAANAPVPRRRQFRYDSGNRIVGITDPLGRQETFVYDERGALLTQRRLGPTGEERTLRLIRDLNGEVVTSVLPDGARIDWTRDAWDRVRVQAEPAYADGRASIELRYGPDDLLLDRRVNGPNGWGTDDALLARTRYGYDEAGRLVRHDSGSGPTTTWFDRDGLPVMEVDPSGARVEQTYDQLGRLVGLRDPLGTEHTYVYDRADRLIEQVSSEPTPAGPVERREHRTYDARGQQTSFTDPLGQLTRFSYDDAGRLVQTFDPAGSVAETLYNAFGEVVGGRTVVAGASIEQRLERDGAGRLVAFVDGTSSRWELGLDDFDALVERRAPDGRADRLAYGADGTLGRTETPGGTIVTYNRRPDGALERVTVAAGASSVPAPAATYARDALGRLTQASQTGSVVERTYDLAGRLTSERTNGTTLTHAYDDVARVVRRTYSDGRQDRLEHDGLGRLLRIVLEASGASTATQGLAVGTVLVAYRYEGTRLVSRTLANGWVTRAGYDAALRLVRLVHEDGAGNALATVTTLFDAAGRRRVLAVTGTPWPDHTYTYDEHGRLIAAAQAAVLPPLPDPNDRAAVDAFLAGLAPLPAGQVADRYVLDAADARTSWTRTIAGATTTRDYQYDPAHRLVRVTDPATGPVAVSHDPDGRRASDGRWSYVHDGLGRLREVRVTGATAPRLQLDWDALGRLARIRQPGGASVTLRRLGGTVLERDAEGGLLQDTPGVMPGEVALRAGPGSLVSLLQDHRGSTLAVVDAAGAPVERHRHEDFGAVSAFDGTGTVPAAVGGPASLVRFGGLEFLPEVGLYIAGDRLYDPETALFLEPDALGVIDSPSQYAYVKHNPIDHLDTSGAYLESAWDVFSLGVGLGSLWYNLTRDDVDWWAVGLDVLGILADTAALILPGVPGGAGAAIRATRAARTSAQAVAATTSLGRGVRYAQAGLGVANAVRGGVTSYEAAREGHYGAAAFGVGLSALGLRGSVGRLASARAAGSVPSALYSIQGNAGAITASGRIWGQTEGRVWAIPQLGAGAARTGMSRFDLPPMEQRILFEFTGEAAGVFRPHDVWGPFTAWKALAGQHVTNLGDLRLDRFTEPTFDGAALAYRSVVTQASHLPGEFAGQSLLRARLRASFPIIFDSLVTTAIATVPAMAGLDADGHEAREPLHPIITPQVPTDGRVPK